MIVVVHSLIFVFRYALKWYRERQTRAAIRYSFQPPAKPAALPLDPEECIVFGTPVYRQRYATVQDVLLDPRWRHDIKQLVDFGCAEFGFFQYVKHLLGITHVLEVDIDELLLKENMFRVQPLTADFLKQRNDPLTVEICRGSVADPDWRIKAIDAVVGIEIIEHLYPDTLDALPYNIFGYAQPKLAIFTTPNADFNILFPNFKGFRHDDHKFEWTREQFQAWALNIVTRFPNYSVTFSGIGKGPKGTESLGCCSQMAVFVKEYNSPPSEVPELCHVVADTIDTDDDGDWKSFGVCTHYSFAQAQQLLLAQNFLDITPPSIDGERRDEYYHTIDIIKYPYTEDLRTPEEKLLHQAMQQIFSYSSPYSRYYNERTGISEIPLYEVVRNFEGTFATEAEIKAILEAADFTVAECTLHGIADERCLCVLYDANNMAGHSSKTVSEYEVSERNDDDDDDEEDEDDDGDADLDGWRARANSSALAHRADDAAPLRRQPQPNAHSGSEYDWELSEQVARGATAKDEAATPSDPLVDSGYQKSLSNAEWSPQSPIDGHFDEHEHDEFAPKLDVNDIKDSIRGGMAAPPAARLKSPSPTAIAAGTSRRRKVSLGAAGARRVDGDDASMEAAAATAAAAEDVKSIADVLMYNSLNRLNVEDGAPLLARAEPPQPAARPQDLQLAQFIVENGDLANNNRDGEGNNYPERHDAAVAIARNADDANVNANAAHVADQDEANRNVQRFRAPQQPPQCPPPPPPLPPPLAPPPPPPPVRAISADGAARAPEEEADTEEELNHASREALFDPNSQADMLADDGGSLTDDADADADFAPEAPQAVVPVNNLFPNWLLQLLGSASYVIGPDDGDDDDGGVLAEDADNDDGAHFYCQGDGIGVHPSMVEVDIDTSSTSSSTDVAQAERTISENDAGSLPADGAAAWTTMASTSEGAAAAAAALAIFGRALDIPLVVLQPTASNVSQDSGEEFFDTMAEPPPPAPPARSGRDSAAAVGVSQHDGRHSPPTDSDSA